LRRQYIFLNPMTREVGADGKGDRVGVIWATGTTGNVPLPMLTFSPIDDITRAKG
jgi:hypothetical protein